MSKSDRLLIDFSYHKGQNAGCAYVCPLSGNL